MNAYGLHFSKVTSNRGVEAKESEIANTYLDVNASSCSQLPSDSNSGYNEIHEAAGAAGQATTAAQHARPPAGSTPRPAADDAASYIQVVVEKYRQQRRPAAADAGPRLPTASSPRPGPLEGDGRPDCGSGAVYILPAALCAPIAFSRPDGPVAAVAATHACPPLVQLWRDNDPEVRPVWNLMGRGDAEGAGGDTTTGAAALLEDDKPDPHLTAGPQQKYKISDWSDLKQFGNKQVNSKDCSPERVEVYYFERGGAEYLRTSGGARAARLEAGARRAGRRAAALLAEPLAAARLLLAAPLALLLHIERCVLITLRGAVTGCVQTASDYALKPALALAFNAVLHPPLVFAANVLRAGREALRPGALAAQDALAPLARLLGALRLVHVHVHAAPAPPAAGPALCGCACARSSPA